MPLIKFANVLLENNDRAINHPSLYCRSTAPVIFNNEDNVWELHGKGDYDFSTYFNALSINKLNKYTTAEKYYLHLELKGDHSELIQTVSDRFSTEPVLLENNSKVIERSDDFQSIDLEFVTNSDTILAGFLIRTEGTVQIKNGYYSISTNKSLREVELVLATTTFKKEKYIESNIKLIKSEIINCTDEVSKHFSMHVIDNGSTLDAQALNSDYIQIHPNKNVGGAGGFTYGMILALEQKPKATHVLLMDDDVAVSPESIKRTYNLLKILNDEYHEAMISGAMLNYGVPDQQWEDTGFMTPLGTFAPAKPQLFISRFEDIIYNEAFRIPKFIRETEARYAAWWYCCIPTSVIEKNGLPLPYFVRCDDAEYGVRCGTPFITMNGLCIWHESFHVRYNAAVERYQTTRNTLIAKFTTGFAPHSDFLYELKNNVRLELKKYGYKNASLVLDAFEDFMKGPTFYSAPGIAEKTFMDANKKKEKMVSFEELQKEATDIGIEGFSIDQIDRQIIDGDKPRTLSQRLTDFVTDNKQKVLTSEGKGFAVIPVHGWEYPAGAIRNKKYLIVIDWHNRTGCIREKDVNAYKTILKRYESDMKQYKKMEKKLLKAYSESKSEVTSLSFWKNYLGL